MLIVAELSINHKQDFNLAVQMIRAAKWAGADAVKCQTFTPDTLTIKSQARHLRLPCGETMWGFYKKIYMPWDWQPMLKEIAEDLGLIFFSTAYDKTAVDFLETLDVPFHKVASPEIVETDLIRHMARTGKPMMISTGMADFETVEKAFRIAKDAGAPEVILLKCTSAYPAPIEDLNLLTIRNMIEQFRTPVGFSDHTDDTDIPALAVAMGAVVIEKHLTLSKDIGCPEDFALDPDKFRRMVSMIRKTLKAMGRTNYGHTKAEKGNMVFRRSLFANADIGRGERFTVDNVRSIRSWHGLAPEYLGKIIGLRAKKTIRRGTPLRVEMVSWKEER